MSDDPNDRHGYSQPTRAQYDALRAERDAALARIAAMTSAAEDTARRIPSPFADNVVNAVLRVAAPERPAE